MLTIFVIGFLLIAKASNAEEVTGKCTAERENLTATDHPVVGRYVPQCSSTGDYNAMQRHGSTGYTWCVNEKTGEEIPGTKLPPAKGQANCTQPQLTETIVPETCAVARQKLLAGDKIRVVGRFTPQCDENGDYLQQQVYGSTGYSWCVDVKTGVEIPGTRLPPGHGRPNCTQATQTKATEATTAICAAKAKQLSAENDNNNSSRPVVGGYRPQCDSNGDFMPMQSSGSTGTRWCVNVKTGETIPGSVVHPGNPAPNCTSKAVETFHSKVVGGAGSGGSGSGASTVSGFWRCSLAAVLFALLLCRNV